tara:strand:- start:70 stop:264 length:195 start_codon:yes stop_codon:yes gene_type:complete
MEKYSYASKIANFISNGLQAIGAFLVYLVGYSIVFVIVATPIAAMIALCIWAIVWCVTSIAGAF